MVDRRFALLVWFVACPIARVAAEPLTQHQILEWWREEKRLVETMELFHGYRIQWSVFSDHVPPPDEIAAMRRRVVNKPDHPDRKLLQIFEDRLAGNTKEYFSLISVSRDRWQIRAGSSPDKTSTVITTNGDLVWDANPVALTVLDATKPYPAALKYGMVDPSFLRDAARFVHFPASIVSLSAVSEDNIEIHILPGRRFSFRTTPNTGSRGYFVGEWPKDASNPIVSEVYFSSRADPTESEYQRKFTFVVKTARTLAGRPVADRVDRLDVSYRWSESRELLSLVPLTDTDLAADRFDLPNVDSIAELGIEQRPDTTPRLRDYRNTRPDKLPHGTVVVRPQGEGKADEYRTVSRPKVARSKRRFRYVGWWIAGAAVMVVVAIVYVKQRQ